MLGSAEMILGIIIGFCVGIALGIFLGYLGGNDDQKTIQRIRKTKGQGFLDWWEGRK